VFGCGGDVRTLEEAWERKPIKRLDRSDDLGVWNGQWTFWIGPIEPNKLSRSNGVEIVILNVLAARETLRKGHPANVTF
jgi:hypothetical protein